MNKIQNILYSKENYLTFHQKLNNNVYLSNSLPQKSIKEFTSKNIRNPNYLFLSLYGSNNKKVHFDLFNDKDSRFKWIFKDYTIQNSKNKLYLSIDSTEKYLILSKNSKRFIPINNYIAVECKHGKKYISLDRNYNIILVSDITRATELFIEKSGIHYMKSDLRLGFDAINLKYGVKVNDKLNSIVIGDTQKLTIGILLAAGNSTRFKCKDGMKVVSKQMFHLRNKPLIQYSIEAMLTVVDRLFIITNSNLLNNIRELVETNFNDSNGIIVLYNDVDCRFKSIDIATKVIKKVYKNRVGNVIIQDSARPFVNYKHYEKLVEKSNRYLYIQYYSKLVNGLASLDGEFIDRNKYVEICTPLCINFELLYFLNKFYLNENKGRISYEYIPLIKLLNLHHKVRYIESTPSQLKRVTYFDDV